VAGRHSFELVSKVCSLFLVFLSVIMIFIDVMHTGMTLMHPVHTDALMRRQTI